MLTIKKRFPVGKAVMFGVSLMVMGSAFMVGAVSPSKLEKSSDGAVVYGQTQQALEGNNDAPVIKDTDESVKKSETSSSQNASQPPSPTLRHITPVASAPVNGDMKAASSAVVSTVPMPAAVPVETSASAQLDNSITTSETASSPTNQDQPVEEQTRSTTRSSAKKCSGLSLLGLCVSLGLL